MRSGGREVVVVTVVVLCIVVGVGLFATPAAADGPAGMDGSGTAGDPYEITNATQLQAMDDEPGAHYELVEDVDATATATWNDGDGFEPIATGGDFTGTFDGNGHAIVGLTINRSGSSQVGLFSSTDGSELSDVRLLDVDVMGGGSTGALVGNNYVDRIADVLVTGSVSGTEDVGGVVGFSGGEITRSASTADVDGEIEVGGLLGYASGATITDSYATGDVTATQEDAGGLVGYNYGTVRRSYATGAATGAPAGGLLGYSSFRGELYTSYWNTDVEGSAAGENMGGIVEATGRTTAQLTGLNATDALPEFDFGTDWATTDGYPTLRAVTTDRTPAFDVTIEDYDASVDANSTMTVDATIRNVGTGDGTLPVKLAADGTPAVDSEAVSLPAGISKQVTLSYEVPGSIDTGSFDVAISTPNETVERSVDVDGYETFSGTLTDGAMGEPVSNATVTVDGDSETQTVQTDANGDYQLAVLNDSTVTVSATPTVATPGGQESITGSTTTTVDGTTTGVDLALWPELGGAGTAADPHEITTVRGLQAMQLDLGAHYVLVDDVDASDTADWNDGRGFDPVGATTKFSGTFDGDGHVVDGLVIDRPDSEHVGLFGVLSGSLSNARVRDATVTGDRGVGTLVGYLTGSVDESAASGTVSGTDDAGGLVGQTQSGAAITDSHAATTVTGESTVGGLVGSLVDLATVEGSFATGEVSGDIGGGLVGSAGGWATVTDAYWNVGTTGQPTSGGDAVGLTTDEMTGANATEFMDGLALESTWIALDGEYPALSGEVTSYDLSLASDEIAVDGGSTDATVIVGLRDGTTATATTTSTYATGGNVSVDGDGTATADAYGPDTVTAAAGGYSDAVAVIALDADYEITFTDVPATAAAGGSYWINATVRNVGNDQGADNVSLAFDGATIFDQSTTVGAGATESIAFEYTVPEDTATGSVALDATTPHDDATRSVHVNGYETLSGTITDGVTGKALSNRNVTVADGAGTRTVTTNASGAYSIEVHNASTAIVSASSRTSWGNGSVAIANSSTTTIRNATTLDLALFQTLPGSGTASDPFRIDTAAELQTISQDLAANYTLVGDIDASGTAVWNDGAGFDPLGGSSTTEFSGTFDGDGHEIEGLTIDRPGSDYVGLFGEAVGIVDDVAIANASVVGNDDVAGLVGFGHEDAEVRNATVSGSVRGTTRVGGIAGQADLPLTNVSVTADVNGTDVVGGLAGIVGSDRIDRSWASGTVTGTDAKIGGLVGNVRNAEITDSWASGDVVVDGDAFDVGGLVGYVDVGSGISNVSATGDVVAPGGDEVGGLVGHHNARIVSNAWASGNVTGNESVGGLFGYAFHSSDSYATGAVTGNASLGGAIGTNSSYATISSVYWDVNATGKNSSAGNATGLTTAQLTGATVNGSLAGFDFERAWTATDGYPRLQTEVESVDLSVDDAALRPGETADATVAIDLVSGDTATATTVANYTSTAPGVATVDGGEIVARGAGSATITATVAGLNASADVRVAARLSTDDGDDDNQPARELNVSVVDLAPEDANFTVGKPVTIDVMVVNDGVATAEYAVVLSLNGTAVATESGTVEAGSTTAVELSHAFDEPGTYTLSVADRSFDVTVESERSGPSDDGDSTDSFGSAGSDDFAGDSRSSGDASPGFGVLGAVVALLAVAAATRRR